MPDVVVEKQKVLDLLESNAPALSATSDMPVPKETVETKPEEETKPEPTAPEEKAAPVAEKPEESTLSEQPDDAAAEPEPKKAKGVQKRIDELLAREREANRRAEAADARLDRALAALEKGSSRTTQVIESEDQEPQKPVKDANNPEAYDAALEEYVTARSSWIARREVKASLAEDEKKRNDKETAEQLRVAQESYKAKVEKAKEKHADFSEKAESPDVQVTPVMANAIFYSEDGPEIAYFLGQNPDEAERISKLLPQRQLLELGKISAKLSTPAEKPKISAAPSPGKPTKPSSETALSPEEEPMETYANRRKKEIAERNRPGARH